jgi:DNA-directed RNA polymerase subunit RPC12/RpoP
MAFVNAVCPSCGASIQLDASVDNGFCTYCGTRISVREAVNKANSEPKNKSAVESKNTNEVLKMNARKSYEVGQYGNAITDWQRAISVDRTDYEAYWGLVLTQMKYKHNYNPETDSDFRTAMSYAPTHKKLEYERYIKEWKRSESQNGAHWDILIRMELLTSLTEHANDKPLSTDDVIKLGIHICRALELCAVKKTIHRDIKPDNIFISQYGDYKLGDLGTVKK